MKKISNISGLWLLMLAMVTVVTCESSGASHNGYVETTWNNAAAPVLRDYENLQAGFTVFGSDGFQPPFYIRNKTFHGKQYTFVKSTSTCLDGMKIRPEADAWQVDGVSVVGDATHWAYTEALTVHQYAKFHTCNISGNNVIIEYVVEEDVKPNAGASTEGKSGYSLNLKIPRLNKANVFVAHSLKVNSVELLDYALKWDDTKEHSSWVAFVFDEATRKAGDEAKRKDNFVIDPLLSEAIQVTDEQHKGDGFDHGHICGSADRLFMQGANDRMFYFSNISPMIHSLNSSHWVEFEGQVRKWGGAEKDFTTIYSKLYVVKDGTLDELLVSHTGQKNGGSNIKPTADANGLTRGGLVRPGYYFMAVLSEMDGTYHAIGFRAERKEYSKAPTLGGLKASALSIDELEGKTGIDFFCNLPDDLENTAGNSMNLDDWAW